MTFDSYLQMIEDAADDAPRLSELASEIQGVPDLDDEERSDLLGRTGTYLGDAYGLQDPHQRAAYGLQLPPVTPAVDWAGLRSWDDTEADDDE